MKDRTFFLLIVGLFVFGFGGFITAVIGSYHHNQTAIGCGVVSLVAFAVCCICLEHE
jgi:hypothetical protein